jgi:hypothetical protein
MREVVKPTSQLHLSLKQAMSIQRQERPTREMLIPDIYKFMISSIGVKLKLTLLFRY